MGMLRVEVAKMSFLSPKVQGPHRDHRGTWWEAHPTQRKWAVPQRQPTWTCTLEIASFGTPNIFKCTVGARKMYLGFPGRTTVIMTLRGLCRLPISALNMHLNHMKGLWKHISGPTSSFWLGRLQCGRPGFDPWVGKITWRRETHSSILTWRTPWTEEPGGLQSMGFWRVRHDWATKHSTAQVGEGPENLYF